MKNHPYFKTMMKKARDEGIEKGKKEGIRFTIENYSAVLLLCLKDKFDFTTKELQQASVYINDTFDNVCEGYLTLDDIAQTLKEENDIELRFKNEVNK